MRGDVLGLLCSANYNRRESAARDVSPRQLPGAAVGSLMDGQRAALVFSDGSFTPCFLKLGQSLTTLTVEGTHIKSRLLLLNNVLSVLPSPDMRAVLVLKEREWEVELTERYVLSRVLGVFLFQGPCHSSSSTCRLSH